MVFFSVLDHPTGPVDDVDGAIDVDRIARSIAESGLSIHTGATGWIAFVAL